ncbi:Flagellar protein FlgJ-like protein [Thermincola ferriacetica]|uniref:Flagellar protein FlgJ-like protein n=1 Tax=Thermincola ferriacetica TaxID=281456 RepID=A0A0L6W023_9FIRM|nr:rod-binding protein [Thermincola ferriacetica]KNZ68419.1 Flagellar protein FlgJ-like protein [Thermincola ferriacetica]
MRIDNNLLTSIPIKDSRRALPEPERPNFAQVLEKAQSAGGDKQIREAAQQLEALLLYQMFSAMRKTVPSTEIFGEKSFGTELFQSMFDQEVSIQAALNGAGGLGDVIYEQLAGLPKDDKEEGQSKR